MRMQRLFEIVYLLLEKKKLTAAQLAEHFEVSTRTIYRDIDELSASGIPIYATRGRSGGIQFVDGFVLDRLLLSEQEQLDILTALQGLSATRIAHTEDVLAKLSTVFQRESTKWISVDFSDWSHQDTNSFEILRSAILHKQVVSFDYYSTYSECTHRTVEPEMLSFKHQSWYLSAFCRLRGEYRLFKLSRVKELCVHDEVFDPMVRSQVPLVQLSPDRSLRTVALQLRVEASQLYRLFDVYDSAHIIPCEDGKYIAHAVFPEDEWVYGFILSFGHYAEVIAPEHIREIIKDRLQKNLLHYNS